MIRRSLFLLALLLAFFPLQGCTRQATFPLEILPISQTAPGVFEWVSTQASIPVRREIDACQGDRVQIFIEWNPEQSEGRHDFVSVNIRTSWAKYPVNLEPIRINGVYGYELDMKRNGWVKTAFQTPYLDRMIGIQFYVITNPDDMPENCHAGDKHQEHPFSGNLVRYEATLEWNRPVDLDLGSQWTKNIMLNWHHTSWGHSYFTHDENAPCTMASTSSTETIVWYLPSIEDLRAEDRLDDLRFFVNYYSRCMARKAQHVSYYLTLTVNGETYFQTGENTCDITIDIEHVYSLQWMLDHKSGCR